MIYEYECRRCGSKESRMRTVAKRDFPVWHRCPEDGWVAEMVRVVSRFLFVAERSADKPENQMLRILTKSGSATDWLEKEREMAVHAEKTALQADRFAVKEDWSFDGIDVKGAWDAAHAGEEQLQRWRSDNIAPDPLEAPTSA